MPLPAIGLALALLRARAALGNSRPSLSRSSTSSRLATDGTILAAARDY